MADVLADLGLKLNYWYLTNRQELRKWWVLVLAAVDVFLLVIFLTQGTLLVLRFREPSNALTKITASTVAVGQAQGAIAPSPLTSAAVATTLHGPSRYDFSSRLENTNATWSAVATVQFAGALKPLTPVVVILPPKSVRYAMALNVEGSADKTIPKGTMSVTDIIWTRLTPAEAAEKIDVKATNVITGLRVLVTGDSQQRVVTQVTGTILNAAFVPLEGLRIAVVLTRNGVTVGVGSTILSRIEAEKSQPFSVEWDTVISDVQQTVVYPEVHRGLIAR